MTSGRLLCELVHEERAAVMRWENEGGALPLAPRPPIPNRVLRELRRYRDDELDIRVGLKLGIALCDAVASDIIRNHTMRRHLTKQGNALQNVARRCRNAIQTVLDQFED